MRSCQHTILKTNYVGDKVSQRKAGPFNPSRGRLSEDNICIFFPYLIPLRLSTEDKHQSLGSLTGSFEKDLLEFYSVNLMVVEICYFRS